MDNQRFDALATHLSVLANRRHGLRVLLTALVAGNLGIAERENAAAHCKGDGKLCRHGGECCSRACLNRKHLKKKNGQRTKQKFGKCGCSAFQQQCHVTSDCCDFLLACGDTGCEDHSVCCKPAGRVCEDDCDCCGDNVCGEESGRCEPQFCSDTQEACDVTSECCNNDEICDFIAIACGRPVPQKHCCGTPGSACGEDCDCCFPFECDEDLGECVAPSCLEPGQRRRRRDGARVSAEGVGPVPCPPDDPVLCCQEGDTCCTAGSTPGCCPAGTVCTAQGCMPPCPPNSNACDFGAEITCGTGPLFAGCKCVRGGESSFCARMPGCIDCQDDADCRDLTGHPAALCIPCPLCQPPASPTMCVIPCVV